MEVSVEIPPREPVVQCHVREIDRGLTKIERRGTKVDPVKWELQFTFRLEPVWVPARVMGGGNGLLENKVEDNEIWEDMWTSGLEGGLGKMSV